MENNEHYVTPFQAAKIINVSVTTIYKLINDNKLKYISQAIGNGKLIHIDDLFQVKRINQTKTMFYQNYKKVQNGK